MIKGLKIASHAVRGSMCCPHRGHWAVFRGAEWVVGVGQSGAAKQSSWL